MAISVPAGPAGAPALRALSIGEILDTSFNLYRRHFGALAVIVLVCSLAPFALLAYILATGMTWAALPLILVYGLATLILGAVATGATVYVISESYLGRSITAREAFERVQPRIGAVLVCSMMLGLIMMIGFVMLFFPGVIFGCGLAVAVQAVVLEPSQTASTALSRSWELTKGGKWRIFGLVLTAFILISIPSAALGGIAALAHAPDWLAAVLKNLVQMFLSPFLYCVLTVAYYDFRVRKEGFDLELLAASLRPA